MNVVDGVRNLRNVNFLPHHHLIKFFTLSVATRADICYILRDFVEWLVIAKRRYGAGARHAPYAGA